MYLFRSLLYYLERDNKYRKHKNNTSKHPISCPEKSRRCINLIATNKKDYYFLNTKPLAPRESVFYLYIGEQITSLKPSENLSSKRNSLKPSQDQ